MADPTASRRVRFGPFEVDLRSGELANAGRRQTLPEQPLALLTALLARPGELVTRDELRTQLWPADTFVDFEHGLNAAVKRLREILDDSAETPQYIETVPRRGYRFKAPVDGATQSSFGSSNEPTNNSRQSPAVSRRNTRELVVWALLSLTAVAGLALTAVRFREHGADTRSVRFSVDPPDKSAVTGSMAISPDGQHLALIVSTAAEATQLSIRRLDSLTTQIIPGTEGAGGPFWSPDGRFIGFFAQGKLKKIDAARGPAQTLCDAPKGLSGTWNQDGVIVFNLDTWDSALYRVSARGGAPTVVLAPDNTVEFSYNAPQFLPDGRHFLYLSVFREPRKSGIFVGSLDSKKTRRILDTQWMAAYASGTDETKGHLLFIRDGRLMAQQFDTTRLQLAGDAVPVADNLPTHIYAAASVSASENGTLAYVSNVRQTENRTLVWVDRQGRPQPLPAPARLYENPRISPDGRRLAVQINDGTASDVWTYDFARDLLAPLTRDGTSSFANIAWADSEHLLFCSNRDGPWNMYTQNADGSGPTERLLASTHGQAASSLSRDGRWLVFDDFEPRENYGDLWVLPLQGERKPRLLRRGSFHQWGASLSPDGHWLAFNSDESGRFEVYVTSFPSIQGRRQISTDGGIEVQWGPDGRELFWRDDDKLMRAGIETTAGFNPTRPQLVFAGYDRGVPGIPSYDIALDGQHFLMLKSTETTAAIPKVNVVVNWLELVGAQGSAGRK